MIEVFIILYQIFGLDKFSLLMLLMMYCRLEGKDVQYFKMVPVLDSCVVFSVVYLCMMLLIIMSVSRSPSSLIIIHLLLAS